MIKQALDCSIKLNFSGEERLRFLRTERSRNGWPELAVRPPPLINEVHSERASWILYFNGFACVYRSEWESIFRPLSRCKKLWNGAGPAAAKLSKEPSHAWRSLLATSAAAADTVARTASPSAPGTCSSNGFSAAFSLVRPPREIFRWGFTFRLRLPPVKHPSPANKRTASVEYNYRLVIVHYVSRRESPCSFPGICSTHFCK